MNLLNAAKNADYVFISVMGPHAQESEDMIFKRKTDDIKKYGESLWVSGINERFIAECRKRLNGKPGYVILVESKSAVDTKSSKPVSQYSEDNVKWKAIDTNISPVTGNLPNKAYCFDDIKVYKDQEVPISLNYCIDLNYYSEVDILEAIKFRQGRSNVFAKRNIVKMAGGMKSHERKIVAVMRLKHPYVVWAK